MDSTRLARQADAFLAAERLRAQVKRGTVGAALEQLASLAEFYSGRLLSPDLQPGLTEPACGPDGQDETAA